MSTITKCDRCGKESEPQKESNVGKWRTIGATIGPSYNRVSKDICPECIKKLGIPEEERKRENDIRERIIEIFEEIAKGVVDNQ